MWGKNLWEDRLFTLLFYVTEINTYNLHHHFKEFPESTIIDFRLELYFQMILNDTTGSTSNPEEFKNRKRSGKDCGHKWVSIPRFCGKWVWNRWRKVKQEYQQQICLCGKNTRRYCRCNKAVPC